jgi:hypothetical protein
LLRQPTNETEPDSDNADVVGGDGSVRHKKSRLRSMSDAIGGLIGGKGKRRKRDEDDGGGGASGGSAV